VPVQLRENPDTLSKAYDIYAMGVTMVEMVTGVNVLDDFHKLNGDWPTNLQVGIYFSALVCSNKSPGVGMSVIIIIVVTHSL
jgi:hypothetical protein